MSVTIQEFYRTMGMDSETMIRRLSSETLVKKYLRKLLEDKTYAQLVQAMETGEHETAFRAAHTLKGLCLNLGLEPLGKFSSQMTELLRTPAPDMAGAHALMTAVTAAYEETLGKIAQIS